MKSQQDASYLIQSVVKTFVEAFQVQQNHCSSGLHANLDSIDVATDLKKHTNENQNLKVLFKAIARIFLHLFSFYLSVFLVVWEATSKNHHCIV